MPVSFSEDVLDLADTLNHCGGFTCTIDHYIDVPPPNWNNWTQQRIEESQYVILVCSPTLAQRIRDPQDHMLNMEKGKYYANGIVNLVHPQKFIPVYLNGHKPRTSHENGWLPPQLRMCTVYNLNISELRTALAVPEGSTRHVLDEKFTTALHDDRFREVAKLVYHLRSESDTTPPVPPQNPIRVPANVHTASHIAQPHPSIHPQFNFHPTLGVQPASNGSVHYVQAVQPASSVGLDQAVQPASDNESLHYVYPTQQQGGLEPEHIPDAKLKHIGIRLKGHWFNLGVKLGVESSELEVVQKSYRPTDYEKAALKMFGLWRTAKKELATKEALKQALVDMGYGRLVQELFQDE